MNLLFRFDGAGIRSICHVEFFYEQILLVLVLMYMVTTEMRTVTGVGLVFFFLFLFALAKEFVVFCTHACGDFA